MPVFGPIGRLPSGHPPGKSKPGGTRRIGSLYPSPDPFCLAHRPKSGNKTPRPAVLMDGGTPLAAPDRSQCCKLAPQLGAAGGALSEDPMSSASVSKEERHYEPASRTPHVRS